MSRVEIFSKDYLTIEDIGFLLGLNYNNSAEKIREIKFNHDRLKLKGKIHIEDYFEYFGITDRTLYKGEIKSEREENFSKN